VPRSLLIRLDPDRWPVWDLHIHADRDADVWFKTGRIAPEDVVPGMSVFVLGTRGIGLVAVGQTTTGVESRSDPDWRQVALEFQEECCTPANRVCVSVRRVSVPLAGLKARAEVADLYRRRETATWLSATEHQVLRELIAATANAITA